MDAPKLSPEAEERARKADERAFRNERLRVRQYENCSWEEWDRRKAKSDCVACGGTRWDPFRPASSPLPCPFCSTVV